MKIIKYSLILGMIAGFGACDVEEYFSPVVELNMPPHTSKLVVAADLVPNSDSLRVFVSKSYGFLDPKLPADQVWWHADTVSGVQVKLFKNNLLWANLTSARNGYYTSGQKIALNDSATYRLEVSAPQYETVTAVQKPPAMVPMLNSTFTADGGANRDGRKIDLYSIEFNDPANVENFYQAQATLKHKDWNGQWTAFTFPLNHFASASDDGGENMLTDKAFNGKAYRWLLQGSYSNIFSQPGDTLIVRLMPISKERYLYNKSETLFFNAQYNPFAEPVLLYTNLQKGYGFFTIAGSYTEKMFKF